MRRTSKLRDNDCAATSRWYSAAVTLKDALADHLRAAAGLEGQLERIARVAQHIRTALTDGGKVLWMGNGGSAGDAQHLAAELVGRFERERSGYASLALTADSAVLTAVANDFGYERVFERQINALCCKGDVVVALSTSGRSPNVVRGVLAARQRGALTVGLTGGDGPLCSLVDECISVPSSSTARVQEVHLLAGHLLCGLVEQEVDAPGEKQHKADGVAEYLRLVASWRGRGDRIVFTNGCFDLVHAGHVDSLRRARECGDRLVVGLNSDSSVSRLKGDGRPINTEADRAAVLRAFRFVDLVVVFAEETPLRLITELRPDVLVKGDDYRADEVVGAEEAREWGGVVVTVPRVEGLSTSALLAAAGRAHDA